MNLEKERQAEFEIQQLLASIPTSKFMSRYELMDKAIDALETSIKRLKAFVRFLSLLSPAKYIEWMKKAYAQYVPGKAVVESKSPTIKQATPTHFDHNMLSGGDVAKTTPTKRYLPTP